MLPEELIEDVDRWRKQQDAVPNRSEAIRTLIAKALKAQSLNSRLAAENREDRILSIKRSLEVGRGPLSSKIDDLAEATKNILLEIDLLREEQDKIRLKDKSPEEKR